MWKENIGNGNFRFLTGQSDRVCTISRFYEELGQSAAFRAQLTKTLTDLPFPAINWETPAVSRESSAVKEFEFVALNSQALAGVEENPAPFREHFREGEAVTDFPNLSRPSRLVVPSDPGNNEAEYPHLLAFLRSAPESSMHEFWKRAASVFEEELGDRPLWISTAGLGVHWLHLRFDRVPKYYRHSEYRKFT